MEEFKKRRDILVAKMKNNSALILNSTSVLYRKNSDVELPFFQDSNFLYLTNFNEPDSLMLIINKKRSYDFILFVRPTDKKNEIWQGDVAGAKKAKKITGANKVFSIKNIHKEIPKLIKNTTTIYANLGSCESEDKKILSWITEARYLSNIGMLALHEVINLNYLLNPMRVIKSYFEIAKIQKAVDYSTQAIKKAIQKTKIGMFEYDIEAIINYEFNKNNLKPAYPSIVASGKNACILHYTRNNDKIKNNSLVLIDAGCQVDGYNADITRTYPANGKFNPAQKQIYNLVLKAQKAGILEAKAKIAFSDIHKKIIQVLSEGLLKLGLLEGNLKDIISKKKYKKFYMHGSGHFLGADVHDVGDYKQNNKSILLQEGMVLTIEPGLYIKEDKNISKKYHNIGVRIEDDILITKNGNRVLSGKLAKSCDEIEAMFL
jgi:Xaa-Pro aminopeptidase